jgi:hypothetical protein
LQAATGAITSSRTLKHWSDVAPVSQPALFQAHKNDTAEVPVRGAPTKWNLRFDIYLYVNTAGKEMPPSQEMNPLLDAIDAALAPTAGTEVQTLGGLVHHCWISGSIETDEGTLGDQAVAIIPVDILAT